MSTAPAGQRPRPDCFVQADLSNAYARLGVSPLASTKEIEQVVNDKLKRLKSQLRRRGEQRFTEIEHEITELQKIEEKIGSPKARARYDQAHPQNELLTVQPAPDDRFADPLYRASLVTAWLVEELGREPLLPSPECLMFWCAEEYPDDIAGGDRAVKSAADQKVVAQQPAAPDVSELDALTRDEQEGE